MTLDSSETRDVVKTYFQEQFDDKNLFPNFPTDTTKISASYSRSMFHIVFKTIPIKIEKPDIEDYFLHIFGCDKDTLISLFYSFSQGLSQVLNVDNIKVGFKSPTISKGKSQITFEGLTALIKTRDLMDICYLLKELKLNLSTDTFPIFISSRMEKEWYFWTEDLKMSWDGQTQLYRQEVKGDGSCLYTSLYYYEKHPELPIILYNYEYDNDKNKPHYEILLLNETDVKKKEISFKDIKDFRFKLLNFIKNSNLKQIMKIETDDQVEQLDPINIFESKFEKSNWLNEQFQGEYGDDTIIMTYVNLSKRDVEVYSKIGSYDPSYVLFSTK